MTSTRPARLAALVVGSTALLAGLTACGSTNATETFTQTNRPSDGVYRTAQPTVVPTAPAVVIYPESTKSGSTRP